MKQHVLTKKSITSEQVIEMLKKLSPIERLKVISEVLPETEQDIEDELTDKKYSKKRSLYGLWKGMGFDVTAEDIAEARKEMWGNFPREDI